MRSIPPTPPPDDAISISSIESVSDTPYDPESAMDWSPTTAQPPHSQPRRSARTSLAQQQRLAPYAATTSAFGGPSTRESPFYGTLPPRPLAPAAKLRNPQPIFQRVSEAKKENFFKQMTGGAPEQNPFLNADPYSDSDARQRKERGFMELAQPKWHLREDQADTGLEAMFDSVFSIRDEPAEVRGEATNVQASSNGVGSGDIWKMIILWGLPLLLGICFAVMRLMGWSAFASQTNQGLKDFAGTAAPAAGEAIGVSLTM